MPRRISLQRLYMRTGYLTVRSNISEGRAIANVFPLGAFLCYPAQGYYELRSDTPYPSKELSSALAPLSAKQPTNQSLYIVPRLVKKQSIGCSGFRWWHSLPDTLLCIKLDRNVAARTGAPFIPGEIHTTTVHSNVSGTTQQTQGTAEISISLHPGRRSQKADLRGNFSAVTSS